MSKRQVWVVEFKCRTRWQTQMCFDGYKARRFALEYLRMFRGTNPGRKAKVTKYIPERPS